MVGGTQVGYHGDPDLWTGGTSNGPTHVARDRRTTLNSSPTQNPNDGSGGNTTTQPSQTQAPSDSGSASQPSMTVNADGWPLDSNGNPIAMTAQQQTELANAINQAVAGIGGGETAGALDNAILSSLRSFGDWSTAQLNAVTQGMNAAEPHGQGFVEKNKNGGNTSGFVSSWTKNITDALTGGANADRNSTTNAPKGSDPFSQLAGILSSQAAGGPPVVSLPQTDNAPTLVPTQSGGGKNLTLALLLFTIAGAIGYYYYRKHGGEKIV